MRRRAIDLDASLFQRRIRTTLAHCIRSFVIFFLVSTFVLYSGLEWRFLTLYNTIPIWDPYSLIHPFSHSLQGLLQFPRSMCCLATILSKANLYSQCISTVEKGDIPDVNTFMLTVSNK